MIFFGLFLNENFAYTLKHVMQTTFFLRQKVENIRDF